MSLSNRVITPKELQEQQIKILFHAKEFGLDPFETIFELVDADEMNETVSYGGFPARYPHWRFGMEYEFTRKSSSWGLHRIYELVINNDPCYAYLLKSNTALDQKLVIAHVYAHSDFFKNNMWFSATNRKMLDNMANHSSYIRRFMERYGQDKVEEFIDCVLSIEHFIDYHSMFLRARRDHGLESDDDEESSNPRKLPSKLYMDKFINPPEYIEKQKKKVDDEKKKRKKIPESPTKDILLFLIENASLNNWQSKIIETIREESYYFAPQGLTKIMNEGWATYWHSRIMTEKALLPEELVNYADTHSRVLGSNQVTLNPYKLGVTIYADIKKRWDTGRFGSDYENCTDYIKKKNWDTHAGLGNEKLFEVRKVHNDITFLDAFLTPEFIEANKLFIYSYNPQTSRYEITTRDPKVIKKHLLARMTNMGRPIIEVVDGNFRNRGELMLQHIHNEHDLDSDEAKDTITAIYKIWQRPVNISTVIEGQNKLLTYDGTECKEESVSSI